MYLDHRTHKTAVRVKDQDKNQDQNNDQDKNQDQQEQQAEEKENKENKTPDRKEVEALIRKALERSEEHDRDKRDRMRKAPLSPNERDW